MPFRGTSFGLENDLQPFYLPEPPVLDGNFDPDRAAMPGTNGVDGHLLNGYHRVIDPSLIVTWPLDRRSARFPVSSIHCPGSLSKGVSITASFVTSAPDYSRDGCIPQTSVPDWETPVEGIPLSPFLSPNHSRPAPKGRLRKATNLAHGGSAPACPLLPNPALPATCQRVKPKATAIAYAEPPPVVNRPKAGKAQNLGIRPETGV